MLTQAEVIFPLKMISSQNFRPNKCNCGKHRTAPFAEVPSQPNIKPTDFRRWYQHQFSLWQINLRYCHNLSPRVGSKPSEGKCYEKCAQIFGL